MPVGGNHKHHGHHGHSHAHSHGQSHEHKRRESGGDEFRWEWFWTCCNCYSNGAMSTWIEQCPGCTHTRCAYCPMESVKIRCTRQPVHWSRTPSAQASQAPEAFDRNDSSIASAERKPPNSNNNSLGAFAALSLAPAPERDASFQSSSPSIIFSLNGTQNSDSATDFGTENTETTDSGGSTVDDVESNKVVRLLDYQVLSLLNDDLELAARLIPKIHDRLRVEDGVWIGDTESQDEDGINIAGHSRCEGKQQASGSSCSPHSGSSTGKHGRTSRGSRKRDEGRSSNKRSRRGTGGSSGGHSEDPDGSGNGDSSENPTGDPSGSSMDNEVRDAYQDPDRKPGDPEGDPGSDPSITTSVGNSFNFACHFYKYRPSRFCFWADEKYEKCSGSRITRLRHIKYHLKQAHTPPSSSPFCRRCFRSFQNLDDLDNHAQETVPCIATKKLASLNDDIYEEQWKQIDRVFCRKGQKHVDDISRWYEIWDILFPGEKRPPHPWVEPPGYIGRPTYDVEDILSKFETRIAADETLQGEEEQIRNRYLHHLRQTLEEEIASCGTTRSRRFPNDQENRFEFTNFSNVNVSNPGQASSIGGDDSHPILVPGVRGDSSNLLIEAFHEEFHDMGPPSSSRRHNSNLRAPTFESIEPSWDLFDPSVANAAFGDQNSQRNFSANWEYPQRNENQNVASMQNFIADQRDGNYIMGHELVAMADILESENRMQNATAPWKDKNSGNRFLGQQ